jgi:SAM-dependent methyltransferase
MATMNFLQLVNRGTPRPWIDGEKIPWNEAGFSQRMLAEHLNQAHNAASRTFAIVDRHVAWIHEHVLGGRRARILDLGCGPGLYLSRLARRGHTGRGIDFGPASVAYARAQAQAEGMEIEYSLEDLRTAAFAAPGEPPFDLATLLYGEFSTFRPADAELIVRKAVAVLAGGGRLLLEPSTFAAIEALGKPQPSWYAAPGGLWSDRPHLCLQDNAWDAEQKAAVERYTIVDAETGAITQYAMTTQAASEEEVGALLTRCGLEQITFYPSLLGHADPNHEGFYAVLAQKPG